MWLKHVKTIINYPPNHHKWVVSTIPKWVVYYCFNHINVPWIWQDWADIFIRSKPWGPLKLSSANGAWKCADCRKGDPEQRKSMKIWHPRARWRWWRAISKDFGCVWRLHVFCSLNGLSPVTKTDLRNSSTSCSRSLMPMFRIECRYHM